MTKDYRTYEALNVSTIGMPMEDLIVFGGPVGRVQNYNNESSLLYMLKFAKLFLEVLTNEEIVSYVSTATNTMNDTYRTYSLSEVPRRYHFRKAASRIGAVLVDVDDELAV